MLNYKKHGKWIGVLAVVLVIIAGAVCLTNAKGDEKLSAKGQKDGQELKEREKTTEENNTDGEQEIVLAEGSAYGYQVQIVYLSERQTVKKEDLGFGMYEGVFAIQTYKDDVKCAEYTLQLADKMYFPADGFDLVIKDYDGDGAKNDFSLGQGQTPNPQLGNFMKYYFFAVNEDGSIMQHTLTTKDGKCLSTIPDNFSKDFPCKEGVITYNALGENGTEEKTAKVVRIVAEDSYTFVFDDMNITIGLPENKKWIQNPETSVDGKTGVITYHDGIADTDVTLRFGKKGQKNVSKFSNGDSGKADEYWSYFTGGKEKLIQVRFYAVKNSMTTTVLSWKDRGMQFCLYADFPDLAAPEQGVDANWPVLAKTAAHIAENCYCSRSLDSN